VTASEKRSFRMAVVNVLIEHQLSLDQRRQQRTAERWPDESDIYTGTIAQLTTLYRRKFQAEGWTKGKK
jgi:hypothetical protein